MNYLKKKKLKNNNCLYLNRSLILEPIFSTLEKQEYFKIFNFFIIICLISILLFSLAYFLSLNTVKDSEKLSQYECGFEPFDEATRQPFDVHFYIVGILFLIFDVEIALLFP
jgi:NADH-quinone oxidoreductase subunit A